jgi:hypothetical protein
MISSTIKLMLSSFFYTADYDIETEDCHVAPLRLHARMYSLADKYCIDSLMGLAKDKYIGALQKNPPVDDYLSSIPEVYVPPATTSVPTWDSQTRWNTLVASVRNTTLLSCICLFAAIQIFVLVGVGRLSTSILILLFPFVSSLSWLGCE